MAPIQNRTLLLQQLAELKRHLEENRDRLDQQLARVAELKKCGHDINQPLELFRSMRLKRDRDERAYKRLLAELGL
jgi:hypothetical protein